jgi:predicted amidophosphoribosyltransferase
MDNEAKALCPDCGAEISKSAERCGECDYPVGAHNDKARIEAVEEREAEERERAAAAEKEKDGYSKRRKLGGIL